MTHTRTVSTKANRQADVVVGRVHKPPLSFPPVALLTGATCAEAAT